MSQHTIIGDVDCIVTDRDAGVVTKLSVVTLADTVTRKRLLYWLVPGSQAVAARCRSAAPGDRVEVEFKWTGQQPCRLLDLTPAPLDLGVPAREHGPEADQRKFLSFEWRTRWDQTRDTPFPREFLFPWEAEFPWETELPWKDTEFPLVAEFPQEDAEFPWDR